MRSMAQYGRSPLAGSAAGAGWDTFGASSSVGDVFPPVAPGALEPADIRLRAPSLGSSRDRSRRESSIARELFGTSADLSLGMPSTQALAADFGFGGKHAICTRQVTRGTHSALQCQAVGRCRSRNSPTRT
jgi:hypothetical protein